MTIRKEVIDKKNILFNQYIKGEVSFETYKERLNSLNTNIFII